MAKGIAHTNTPMAILATTAIGALMYLIVTMFVPFVGGSIESGMGDQGLKETCRVNTTGTAGFTDRPCTGIAGENVTVYSRWNQTYNNLPSAADTWATLSGFLQIAAIFAVMALVFMFLRGMI